MDTKNDKTEFLESIINSKTIKKRIITYSSQIIQESKENESDDELIRSTVSRIIYDIQLFGVHISDNEINYVTKTVEKLIRKQLANSRMADKIRASKGSIINKILREYDKQDE